MGLRHTPTNMSKTLTAKEVSDHASADSAWVIIDGGVYDVTEFLEDHPGGKKVLLKACGEDSSAKFWQFHSKKVLEKVAKPFLIGNGACRSRSGRSHFALLGD